MRVRAGREPYTHDHAGFQAFKAALHHIADNCLRFNAASEGSDEFVRLSDRFKQAAAAMCEDQWRQVSGGLFFPFPFQ